jgi:hypothetical protein
MKKIFLSFGFLYSIASSAQFDASKISAAVSGNYMSFFKEKVNITGAKIDLGYRYSEKMNGVLSFTYSFPLKTKSSYSSYTGSGSGTYTIPTEASTKVSTISLGAQYFVLSNPESFSLYLPVGASLVLVSESEKATGASTPVGFTLPDQGKVSFSSFMIYGGIGGTYPIGPVNIFADANIALPANNVNGTVVEVNLSSHLLFNVGVRIPFGKPDFDE